MNKKHFLGLLVVFFMGSLCLTSCQPEVVTINIDEDLLVGTWYAMDNTQEFWRFDAMDVNDSTRSGETWDESEDVQEGEGNKFYWEVKHNQLQIDLYGEMGQHVYYDYSFTAQSATSFTWKDLYGNSRTFTKK